MAENMHQLQKELAQLTKNARLSSAVDDVDKMIALLTEARERVASASDPHAASLTMTKLQNPIREGFDRVNEDLRAVTKAQKDFGRSLDKSFPVTALPTDHDVMADHSKLINRAIAMHLLREGQFSVARTFMEEAGDLSAPPPPPPPHDRSDDTDMDTGEPASDFSAIQSQELQAKFESMYSILQALKSHDLAPAIDWARSNSKELEARGSNLEFELCKLQYVWLFKTAQTLSSSYPPQDLTPAFTYAREHFSRFQARHLKEIQKLAAAMVFAPNIRESPYASIFETGAAFEEVAASFTREFCSLLGLSAESPLYVAATAGAIALPRFVKFIGATKSRRTEWTTANELAFETPLPHSMIYHSIFVCPVSKEQTTDRNPPMILPCGHVLAKDSLHNLTKGVKFKCPYCPSEGQLKDARHIIL